MRPQIDTDAIAHQLVAAVQTVSTMGAMLALLVPFVLVVFGQARIKMLFAGMVSAAMCLICGRMVALFAPEVSEGGGTPPAPAPEIDWVRTGEAILAVLLILLLSVGAVMATSALRARATRRREAGDALARSRDPVTIATALAPDMLDDVRRALDAIARLRKLAADPQDQADADALTLATRQPERIMAILVEAGDAAADDDERRGLARKALASIVDIGRSSDEAADRIARRLGDGLDTQARYVRMRIDGV
jgi:hypothetical protein